MGVRPPEELAANLKITKESFKEEFGRELPDEMIRGVLLDILRERTNSFLKSRYRDWGAQDLGGMFALVVPKEEVVVEPLMKRRGRPSKGG